MSDAASVSGDKITRKPFDCWAGRLEFRFVAFGAAGLTRDRVLCAGQLPLLRLDVPFSRGVDRHVAACAIWTDHEVTGWPSRYFWHRVILSVELGL